MTVTRFVEKLIANRMVLAVCWLLSCPLSMAQAVDDRVQRNFLVPPESAKPRVWWHWMNGNISESGIKLDLEWMHRVGIGGVQTFDTSIETPKVVDDRLVFMTSPWRAAFVSAATEADRWGLELAIAGSPGFSESGGPWVEPARGMKKLVWSETRLDGGTALAGGLPRPPGTVGPFQDAVVDRSSGSLAGIAPLEPVPNLYRDVAVVAYRVPDRDRSMSELTPVITSSVGSVDSNLLWDGSFARAIDLPDGEKPAWIQVDFGQPVSVQSMSVGLQNFVSFLEPRYVGVELDSSVDGSEFKHVVDAYDTVDDVPNGMPPTQETVTFAPVTARFFRLLLPAFPRVPESLSSFLSPSPTVHKVTEFVLYTTPRVDHFEQKAAYFVDSGLDSHSTRHVSSSEVVDPREVIDLTGKLGVDGTLRWVLPPGRWAILRVGYSLLGVTNEDASIEGTGLEVDKLDRDAVKAHMDSYLGRYESMLGRRLMGRNGLRAMVSDSWEAGAQNWTESLPIEFARRRGYELWNWLPALTGRIIGSAEATDRFLWDFRRTLGELLTENHYGQITASLHARGMIHYGESHETSRAFIGDGMDAKRDDDIPMGAMWMPGSFVPEEQGDADIRESASVAHIYGQNLVAAESMTVFGAPGAAYAFAPDTLKPVVDRELSDGLNLFVIHTSVHQPLIDRPPGVTMGPFGQWFTRQETWAELATPWVTYLARSAYLLQQGHFVADVAYYYGQDSNITALYGQNPPSIPEGYAFDFASADALTKLSVRDGDLVTASGMRYRVLILAERARLMSLDVLKTMAQLVKGGATVIGEKPLATPSLVDDVREFRALTDTLWGTDTFREHHYGKGKIFSNRSARDVFAELKLEPDFRYSKPQADTLVWFVHRRLTDGDLYFVNNRQNRPEQIEARFRVSGKAPELWHADTGVTEPAAYWLDGDQTVVPLKLSPQDALFVVFRKQARERERTLTHSIPESLGTLTGPWQVHFQPGRGAPEQATFTELESWTANVDHGIKYFAGTASYRTTLRANGSWLTKGQRLEIDLGAVENVAEVFVGRKAAGILWKRPYRIDVTKLIRPGINHLTIRVTNLWANRLIGDQQPNVTPIASTTFNPYKADSPLLPSGLLGPVTILRVKGGSVQSQ